MSKLIAKIECINDPNLPESERCVAVIEGAALVVTGSNPQEAWSELITSLGIWIAHNSGLDYKELNGVKQEQKHYGYYQLCPKCDGEGEVRGTDIGENYTLTTLRTCPVCNGAKLLVRPEIKNV